MTIQNKQPTGELRFIERVVQIPLDGYLDISKTKMAHILQMQYRVQYVGSSDWVLEWEDVPCVTE
jgi:hypothetical protein